VVRWAEAGSRHGGGRPETGGWAPVTSVFIGGGTPTLLSSVDLVGLLAVVGEHFELASDVEVTIEANPESVEEQALASLVAAGINRVSIGAQSFAPHVLATLERRHDPERPLVAVETARAAGVENVSIDLIFGTPGETDADWERTVQTALTAGTDHVSAYALTVAANTPLARRVAMGDLPSPDDDVQRRRFDFIRHTLATEGFDHYEVSNWARSPAHRCRHNLLYWRHGDYLGIGVGAHGHLRGRRWWSHRSIERYCSGVEADTTVISGEESLSVAERAEERLLLGLRVADGLHPFDLPPLHDEALEDVLRAGLARLSCGRLQATDDGWFLLDETLSRLLA
ncbi:MAG: radical SAM family heme chaperone HemW, partial [Actinomycetota bacterium]|nr:radical SAM family heme chaperone HemW [Actinomycetota bacterium]